MVEIGEAEDPDAVKASPAMKRLLRFIAKFGDTSTRAGRAIEMVEDGVRYARDLAGYYNGMAQWGGLPQVPAPLLKMGGG